MSLIHYLFTIYTDSAWRHVSDKLLACIDRVGSCNVMVSGTESGCYGAFTPEQDNDKTTTRQKLNLCISIMPFTPGLSDLV